jgi:hypothetical protein
MPHLEPEHTDPELDSFLREIHPAPHPEWARSLEGRLLPRAAKGTGAWRLPHVRLGAALVGGFAVLLLTLALAGVGPFGGNAADVRAKDDCELVQVTRVERVPALVQGSDGQPRIVYHRGRVQRFERRCR